MKILFALLIMTSSIYAVEYHCQSKKGSELSILHTDEMFSITIEKERYKEIDKKNHFSLEGDYILGTNARDSRKKIKGSVYSHNLEGGWWFEFDKKSKVLHYISNKLFLGYKTTFRAKCSVVE